MPPLGSQLLRICTQRHNIYNTALSRFSGFPTSAAYAASECVSRSNQRDSESLNLLTTTPGTTSTISTSSASSLFLSWFSGVFSSPVTHATIHLQPRSHTASYQTPGSSGAVLQARVMRHSQLFCAMQAAHYSSLPLGPRCPAFSTSPDIALFGTGSRPWGAGPSTTTTSSCTRSVRYSHTQFAEGPLCKRGCNCSTTCTRLLGLYAEATSCDVQYGACCSGPC